MNDYTEYLTSLHAKLITPDEVLNSVVFEATKKQLKDKRRIIAGEASEVYDIELETEKHVILRIARGGKKQYDQEAWAIEQVKKADVPVPEVLLIKHLPSEGGFVSFCVQSKLPGEPLERSVIDFGQFDENRRKRIINSAGEVLSRIHTIRTKGFGYLEADGTGPYATFGGRMSENLTQADTFFQLAKKYDIPQQEMQKVLDILSKKANTAPTIEPVLCHNDYNIKHILIDESDRITGIIDWGEVQGGSPIDDFAKWDYWYGDSIPTKWLEEGYSNQKIFSGNYEELVHWIRLDCSLGSIYWYDQVNYIPGVETAKTKLITDLEFFNP